MVEHMNKFESSYSKFVKGEPYRVACSQCGQLYVKANDEPFVCLTCAANKRLR
jgi:formylmethanofuran dehydrogenase subunit E